MKAKPAAAAGASPIVTDAAAPVATTLTSHSGKARYRLRATPHHIEDGLAAAGKTPAEASIEEMESLWQDAKRNRK